MSMHCHRLAYTFRWLNQKPKKYRKKKRKAKAHSTHTHAHTGDTATTQSDIILIVLHVYKSINIIKMLGTHVWVHDARIEWMPNDVCWTLVSNYSHADGQIQEKSYLYKIKNTWKVACNDLMYLTIFRVCSSCICSCNEPPRMLLICTTNMHTF